MVEAVIRAIARARWIIVVLWVVIAVGSVFVLPNLQTIVRQTETKFLPSDAESVQAKDILDRIDPSQKQKSSAVIVFHRDGGLTDADRSWLKEKVAGLNKDKASLEILSVLSSFDNPQYSEKFESKDKSTQLVVLGLEKGDNVSSTQENIDKMTQRVSDAPQGSKAYLTGSGPISKDFQKSSEDGLKKTEIITVVLVLFILLIVFRSPIAPFVPLITIGLSFVITSGLVALFTKFGMPVSSFTQSFLIAIMFGAGTDYCILMIQRFREELSKGHDKVEALVLTGKAVGKTVAFSGSTVFLAFFIIGFAQFGLYQSAVGVAVGIAVTLLVGLTLAPALLIILGTRMFWPVKIKTNQGHGHGDSKLWASMSRLVVKRPALILIIAILVLSPLIGLYHGNRSFDDLAEVDQNAGSVIGFKQVEKQFGSGDVFPITITITSSKSMRTPEGLAALEKTSDDASRVKNIMEIRSATRPIGQQIAGLTVPNQLGQTNKALNDVEQGLKQIHDGLDQAHTQIVQSAPQMTELQQGLTQLSGKTLEAKNGLQQVGDGLNGTEDGLNQLNSAVKQSTQTVNSMSADLSALLTAHPELKQDASFAALQQKQQGVSAGLTAVGDGLQPIQNGLNQMIPSVNQITNGLGQLADGQTKAATGTTQLQTGIDQLAKGLNDGTTALGKASDGIGQIRQAQQGIVDNGEKQIGGWYLPQQVLDTSDDLKKSLDAYVSPDGKTTKLEAILKINPYSSEALATIDTLRDAIKQSLSGSAIQNADVKLTGTTAQDHELDKISKSDILRTGALVLIGIYVVLALMLGSILAPLYILLSLVFNYYITMGIIEFIFVKLLGYTGLSWTVSFFVFLIIVALGVDYSIFLMARFKEEYRPGGIVAAIQRSMATTGGVIMSAAVIMSGTFAAFLYSGVHTLEQIGAGIVVGLVLYTTVFMGFVVPALVTLFGEANWWPSKRAKKAAAAEKVIGNTAVEA
ncbi:MAG: hypothetical protein JWM44_2279 [Bacilli bacterium]|nr:hypothetical protein [Bacilli bacterium]